MANGDIKKLGTFYMNGVKQARPIYLWNGTPTGAPGAGNVPAYSSGNIEIRDTDSADAYKMQWVEVTRGGKTVLYCDRVSLVSVSWDTLNAQGLIFGKEVTIDGQKYLLRSLTGGSNYRNTSDAYAGGTPTNNEWDQIICNEANLPGLPTPNSTDLDRSQNETDRTGTHNSLWNWYYVYSWCQETYTGNSSTRAGRGYFSARYWNYGTTSTVYAVIGWRPCLEVLKTAPLISDSDRDLGALTAAPSVSYSITEGDGDVFSILEKLDGTTIRSLNNRVDGTFTVDLASRWAGLSLAKHTLEISATNTAGTSKRTITFTKTNAAPVAPIINGLSNNMRIPGSGYVEFTPGADAEGDTQTAKLQFATNSGFTSGLVEFKTGLQKYDGSDWQDAESIEAGDVGGRFRLPYNGIAPNATRYIRVVASDAYSASNSTTVTVKVGNVLEFKTLPQEWGVRPTGAYILMESVIDPKATLQVLACNNALDAAPTWEDAKTDYQAGQTHMFTNEAKTADAWAVSAHIIVTANDATDVIEISAVGIGVS